MKKNIRILAFIMMMAASLVFAGCADEDITEEDADIEYEEEDDTSVDEEYAEDEDRSDHDTETAEAKDEEDYPETDEEETYESEDDEYPDDEDSSMFCFDTTTLDGTDVNTKDIFSENRITMVNVWASWCGPCVMEIPELEKMSGQLREKDCGIVGLLIDGEDPNGLADAKDILSDASAQYTNLVFPSAVSNELNIQSVPTTYFVDSKGNILGEPVIGARPQIYLETIDSLLASM